MERVTLQEAVDILTTHCDAIMKTEQVSLWESLGRVLAEDVQAMEDQPPFPRSPLDGYALQSGDTIGACKEHPVTLKVVDEIMAGHVGTHIIHSGEAALIMTGAPIPEGADCVIRQEDTDYGEETVSIYCQEKEYGNYCFRGEDYKKDTILLEKGTTVTAAEAGILASSGRTKVSVYQKPAVALITTGDETVQPGTPLAPGKIYDSNLYATGARLLELGIKPISMEHVDDEVETMTKAIQKASQSAQLIITTGGVSVGKKDIMHEVFEQAKVERLFWRVKVKPGTPTLCGKLGDTLIICLSGNPFGAFTNMELLVRPVLAKMMGKPQLAPRHIIAQSQSDFPKGSKITRYVRALYEGGQVSIPKRGHASGIISTLTGCNCLIEIPAGEKGIDRGDSVCVILF